MTNSKKPTKVDGMIVTCGRCLEKYPIYKDIQRVSIGTCPACSNVEGFHFVTDHTYSVGNAKPHLEDEGAYDWEWLDYTQSADKEEIVQ